MIQQRADALVDLIQRQRDLSAQVRQLEGFRGQLQEIDRALARLAPLMRSWRCLRDRNVGDATTEQASVLLQQLTQLRERYESDHTTVLGPNRLASLRGVHALMDELQQRLLIAWQEFAQKLVPQVNDEVLNVLSRIPVLKTKVDAVWTGMRELQGALQRVPAGSDDIVAFEARADAVRRSWDTFDTEHLQAEVLRFLKDAGGSGAELDALTDTVREWLRTHNLVTAFRIRSNSSLGPVR